MQKLIVAALLFASTTASVAQANYSLSFSGAGTHIKDAFECPGQICIEPTENVDFFGTLVVTTSTALDGVFTGSSLLAFELNSNLFSLSGSFAGPNEPFSVTVDGGTVVSISGMQSYAPLSQSVTFQDMTIQYSQGPQHHLGPTFASATISAIPEPGVLSMLCVGIPTMVWAARRKRRDDDHQPAAGPRRVLHRLGRQLHGDPA
jgi:hypothetical protein